MATAKVLLVCFNGLSCDDKSQKKVLSGLGAVKCILGWIANRSAKVIKENSGVSFAVSL